MGEKIAAVILALVVLLAAAAIFIDGWGGQDFILDDEHSSSSDTIPASQYERLKISYDSIIRTQQVRLQEAIERCGR